MFSAEYGSGAEKGEKAAEKSALSGSFPTHPFLATAENIRNAVGTRSLTEKLIYPYHILLPTQNSLPLPGAAIPGIEAETDLSDSTGRGSADGAAGRWQEELRRWQAELAAACASSNLTVSEMNDTGSQATVTLQMWQVRGFFSQGGAALKLLKRVHEAPALRDGRAIAGPDFIFWVKAGRLVVEILYDGKFYPDAMVEPTQPERLLSFWSVVKQESAVKEQIRMLAEEMPPACLAYFYRDEDALEAVGDSPESLLNCFVDGIVQQAVTGWLQRADRQCQRHPEEKIWLTKAFRPGQKLEQTKAGDCWLSSLIGRRKEVELEATDWFVQGIKKWQAPICDDSGWGICLVAHPIEDDTSDSVAIAAVQWWRLDIMLADLKDRTILIPATWIWGLEAAGTTTINALPFDAAGRLWQAIIRAATVFPPLERLKEEEAPTSLVVSTAELAQLLTLDEKKLNEIGLSVRLPDYLSKAGKASLRGTMKSFADSGSGLLGLDAVIDFDWKVAIEGEEMSPEEFERLVALRLPVVRIRNRFVLLSESDGRKLVEFWRRKQAQPVTVGDVLRSQAGDEIPDAADLDLDLDCDGWMRQLLSGISGDGQWQLLPQPAGFCGTMRPYQLRGFSWLKFLRDRGIGACLADDMGLGKTIQVIALLLADAEERQDGAARNPVLIVCPTSVVGNWRRELKRFAPSLRVMVHHGPDRPTGSAIKTAAKEFDVVLTTYGVALRDKETLERIAWEGIILDEAQNIKNPHTKQARALRELEAGYRVALTGTPVENNLVELWSIMHFLNPGYLGSLKSFKERYAARIERRQDEEALTRLRRLIQPLVLRRVKTDPQIAPDLPDKLEIKVYCGLTRQQAELYQAVVKDISGKLENAELKDMERRGLLLAALTRLKQIVDHPALFLRDEQVRSSSGKLQRLEEMLLEAMAEGEKCLVFTQYARMGHYLQKYLQRRLRREVLFLHGGVPQKKRMEMVDRFHRTTTDVNPVFILSLRAGGTGLNLTAATHVFHYDRWWNPAVENQATDRAYRIGQTRKVQVYKFICGGTLEERIDQLIDSKRELAENVIGTGESWLTELSNEEFRELITLQAADIID